MSKAVKALLCDEIRRRLAGVNDLLVVNVVGMDVNTTVKLRKHLREQNLSLMVVRNSLARRATEGTALAPAFEGLKGNSALVWGSEDLISLAKVVTKLGRDGRFAGFQTRGGVMDGSRLTAEDVERVSTWPSRSEQLSMLVGQILSPAGVLCRQLGSVGGALVSQIKQRAEEGSTTDMATSEPPSS